MATVIVNRKTGETEGRDRTRTAEARAESVRRRAVRRSKRESRPLNVRALMAELGGQR